jgi:hypothetical protein
MPSEHYPVPLIGTEQQLTIPVSFETDEQGEIPLSALPYRVRVKSISHVVTKALADTNDGTVTVKKGTETLATLTVAASAAIGDEDSDASPVETSFETSDQIRIETAKTKAGGKGLLTLTLEILPSHSS